MLCAAASQQSVLDHTVPAPQAVVADEPSAMLGAVAAQPGHTAGCKVTNLLGVTVSHPYVWGAL